MNYNLVQTFFALLTRDVLTFQQHITTRMIDAIVWCATVLYVYQYFVPFFGMDNSFALFLVTGNLAVWGMFEVGTNLSTMLGDLYGANSISYYLTLPIPQNWIFIRIALMDAYKSFIPTLPLLLVSKIVLLANLSLTDIHYPKLLLCWILSHIFFGFFGLFVSSLAHSFEYTTTIRQRILFPMWFLGGYQFTWHMMYQAHPTVAYLSLLNPLVYILEAMHHCMPTDLELLPFWLCIMVTIFFTILFGFFGIRQFKKRLDCLPY